MPHWEKGWDDYLETKRIVKEDNSAWSGPADQHPYQDDFNKNAEQVFSDLNGAFVTVQAMIMSSPGHPKNTKLKQIEQQLKQMMRDIGEVSK